MPEQPTITVTGAGLASGSPDQCRVRISLNHLAESAPAALEVTADLANRAIRAVAEGQVEHAEVQTVGLSVQDFFDKAQQKVTAHMGSYQLDLIIRPIEGTGRVLAGISSVVGDALQIRGVTLTVQDPEPLKSRARRSAIQDAKKRAAEIADEVGVRVGPILSIRDDNANSVRFAEHATLMSAPAAAGVPIEAGNVSATSAVTLVYAIEG
jgi:uncharacterized protein YggE